MGTARVAASGVNSDTRDADPFANVRAALNERGAFGRYVTEQAREIVRLTNALEEIVRREARSEYSSIYAAPSEFAQIARDALRG